MPLSRRPGVVRSGWLSKEGPHTLSKAFPSRRFCVVVDGRLEYYEEKGVPLHLQAGGSSGCELTDWNLVVHVMQPDAQGVAIGDIITAIDGLELGKPLDAEINARGLNKASSSHKLALLRPKGDVPLADALVESIGRDRIQITPKELNTRPPYVFIANGEASRNDWLEAIEQHARSLTG